MLHYLFIYLANQIDISDKSDLYNSQIRQSVRQTLRDFLLLPAAFVRMYIRIFT